MRKVEGLISFTALLWLIPEVGIGPWRTIDGAIRLGFRISVGFGI